MRIQNWHPSGLPSKEELEILEPFRKDLPDEVFTKEFKPPETRRIWKHKKTILAASKLLKAAGWEIKDGKRVNSGQVKN
ncbi:MAG: hypothetical protein Ct9H300mP28_15420 [Pseudomonadota bacterium]|nr:MAG: hypothetical protein Ct9H300mP28_15420 [Pseudomonadota bacterium]